MRTESADTNEVSDLLMTNYDFYDIYFFLVAIRFKPQNECNAEIVQSVIDIISAPQNGNDVDSNIVRKKIREIYNLDRDLFNFAFVDNYYTYGIRFIKEDYPYSILKNAFDKLLKCINDGDYNQVYALADTKFGLRGFDRNWTGESRFSSNFDSSLALRFLSFLCHNTIKTSLRLLRKYI